MKSVTQIVTCHAHGKGCQWIHNCKGPNDTPCTEGITCQYLANISNQIHDIIYEMARETQSLPDETELELIMELRTENK